MFVVVCCRLTEIESRNSRDIIHFHYTTWPDFGVPESPTAFLNFLMVVRESGALDQNVGPPVVHCSAGIGRSGTFCLVDSCLVLVCISRLYISKFKHSVVVKPEGFAVLTLNPALDTFLSQFTPTYYSCMAEFDRKIVCMI